MKTAQSLRLLKAFLALESQPVREALLFLAESFAAAGEVAGHKGRRARPLTRFPDSVDLVEAETLCHLARI